MTNNKRHTKKSKLNNWFDISVLTSKEKMGNSLPYILFLGVLCMVYIWNIHFAEKTIRAIDKTNKSLKEFRWEICYRQVKFDA